MTLKQALTNKLFDAITELKLRQKSGSLSEIQRMFGYVLGMRVAIMEVNKANGEDPYNFSGRLGIDEMLKDNFGQMNLKQVREYRFPSFLRED